MLTLGDVREGDTVRLIKALSSREFNLMARGETLFIFKRWSLLDKELKRNETYAVVRKKNPKNTLERYRIYIFHYTSLEKVNNED